MVIGSGPFGLSFAQSISNNFDRLAVFARNKETARQIEERAVPSLPSVKLSPNIKAFMSLEPFVYRPVDLIVLALPVSEMPSFAKENAYIFSKILVKNQNPPIVSLSKGFFFEGRRIRFIEELLLKAWPAMKRESFFVVSGPSFALEMAQGEKTFVSLAGHNDAGLKKVKKLIAAENIKFAFSRDTTGAAFGGAIKNALAIAHGIAKGLGLKHNARAALLVRGTEELIKIGEELGASHRSFLGPAYLGDLILSLEKESRNSRLGLALGQGQSLEGFLAENPQINVEGVNTIKALNSYLTSRRLSSWRAAPLKALYNSINKKKFVFIVSLYKIVHKGEDPKLILSVLD